ncbi:MAG: hypothetical protein KDB07_09975 [Planctomycetes bacterium]|nr:hypothetical protein [Planctomycetota bacterium]
MPYARHMQAATLDFVIGDTDPLPKKAALLACAAAMVADGHLDETTNVLTWVLGEIDDPEALREIIVQTHLFAG